MNNSFLNLRNVLCVLGVCWLTSCSTFSKSREQNLYQVHIGQSKAELLAALGQPSKQIVLGSEEKWLYDVYSADNRQIYPYTATFENGTLAKWDFDTLRNAEDVRHSEMRTPSSSRY